MTEDEYQRELDRIKDKPDIEEHCQSKPNAGSSVRTIMFICACVALAMLAYFGFVVYQ